MEENGVGGRREGKRWEEEGAKGEEGIIEEVAREVAVRGGNNTERRSGMGKGKTKQMRRWKVYGEGVVGRGWGGRRWSNEIKIIANTNHSCEQSEYSTHIQ